MDDENDTMLRIVRRLKDAEHDIERLKGIDISRPILAKVYHNANQSIPDITWTPLAFNSEHYDTDTMHNVAVNNSRITIFTTGYYLVGGSITFESVSGGYRSIGIRSGGANFFAVGNMLATAAIQHSLHVSTLVYCVPGTYFELMAWQNTGAPINALYSSYYTPDFWAVRQP